MTELGELNYAELLAHLRKDLRLDARSDLLAGTLVNSLNGATGDVTVTKKTLGLSWGTVLPGSATIADAGSGDWTIAGTATGAVQILLPAPSTIIACWAGPRQAGSFSVTVQAANPGTSSVPSSSPVISLWSGGVLSNGFAVTFLAIHS